LNKPFQTSNTAEALQDAPECPLWACKVIHGITCPLKAKRGRERSRGIYGKGDYRSIVGASLSLFVGAHMVACGRRYESLFHDTLSDTPECAVSPFNTFKPKLILQKATSSSASVLRTSVEKLIHTLPAVLFFASTTCAFIYYIYPTDIYNTGVSILPSFSVWA